MRYIIVRKSVFLLLCICGAAFLANYGLHITICKSTIKYDMINKIVLGGTDWPLYTRAVLYAKMSVLRFLFINRYKTNE